MRRSRLGDLANAAAVFPICAEMLLFTASAATPTWAAVVERNWARGKPSSQSSTALNGDSARAIDGNTDGAWAAGSVTHTEEEEEPYWQVDLGAAYQIAEIRIFNRTDECCQDRLRDFVVVYVNNRDGFLHRGLDDTLKQSAPEPVVAVNARPVFFPGGVRDRNGVERSGHSIALGGALVRFLRIQKAGRGILSLAEVEVVEKKTIAGPSGFADQVTWAVTPNIADDPMGLVAVEDLLVLLTRGRDGLLHSSIDFAPDEVLPGSPRLAADAPAAVWVPSAGRLFAAVRTAAVRRPRQRSRVAVLESAVTAGQLTSSGRHHLGNTSSAPAVAAACGQVIVAWQDQQQIWSSARPASGGSWTAPQAIGPAISRPSLAVNSEDAVGVAFLRPDHTTGFAKASCAGNLRDWTFSVPSQRRMGGDQVSVAAWGRLFAVAGLGDDGEAYYAVQRTRPRRGAVWSSFEPIGAPLAGATLMEAPRLVVFSGLTIALERTNGDLRYWIRVPNAITAANDGWIGGGVVGLSGIGVLPPAAAAVGRSDNWSTWESPAELFVTTQAMSGGRIQALNFGRFLAREVMTHVFGVSVGGQTDIAPQSDHGLDLVLVPNLFEHMMALLGLPRASWPLITRRVCEGIQQPTRVSLTFDPGAGGTTEAGRCPFTTLLNSRPSSAESMTHSLMHEWMHIDVVARNLLSLGGFAATFRFSDADSGAAASGLTACSTSVDCGGDPCEEAGDAQGGRASTRAFRDDETLLRRWDEVKVCVSGLDGVYGRRYQGGVSWYDLGTSDHAFINTAVLYRWYGDELREMARADAEHGNDQLQRRYDWLKANYFGGVEYNGRRNGGPPPPGTNRTLGQFGMPLQ